jgi:hypothetical protein
MIQGARRRLAAGVLALGASPLCGCQDRGSVVYDFQFSRGPQGWVELFADYPANKTAIPSTASWWRRLSWSAAHS